MYRKSCGCCGHIHSSGSWPVHPPSHSLHQHKSHNLPYSPPEDPVPGEKPFVTYPPLPPWRCFPLLPGTPALHLWKPQPHRYFLSTADSAGRYPLRFPGSCLLKLLLPLGRSPAFLGSLPPGRLPGIHTPYPLRPHKFSLPAHQIQALCRYNWTHRFPRLSECLRSCPEIVLLLCRMRAAYPVLPHKWWAAAEPRILPTSNQHQYPRNTETLFYETMIS